MIKIKNLSFQYALGTSNAIEHIDLHIKKETLTLLTGPSGCGKTTLLRHMKKELMPVGKREGTITIGDWDIRDLSSEESVKNTGFLMQNPASQIVMDTVWHEIAFGLENLGMSLKEMKKNVAEVVNYFNLATVYDQNPQELSGGQQQMINLASIMAMHPKILLLDEPTAMLDPVARKNFISLLLRLKEDYGMTIVMIAHNLEDVLEAADTCIYMKDGKIDFKGDAREYVSYIKNNQNDFSIMLPQKVQILMRLNRPTGFSGKEVREAVTQVPYHVNTPTRRKSEEEILTVHHLFSSYDKKRVLDNLNLSLFREEVLTICGANGSGKSTLLKCLIKEQKYAGKVKCKKKLLYLPQDPTLLFVKERLYDDLLETGKDKESELDEYISLFGLTDYLNVHPYDLSGGLRQMAALVKLIMAGPDILLLDEPTKGVDALHADVLADLLRILTQKGISIICVTHDLSFAAKVSDRIGILFDGKVESISIPEEFLCHNYFYTTECAKLTRMGKEQSILPCFMEVDS